MWDKSLTLEFAFFRTFSLCSLYERLLSGKALPMQVDARLLLMVLMSHWHSRVPTKENVHLDYKHNEIGFSTPQDSNEVSATLHS